VKHQSTLIDLCNSKKDAVSFYQIPHSLAKNINYLAKKAPLFKRTIAFTYFETVVINFYFIISS
jgi:hypothetical protein